MSENFGKEMPKGSARDHLELSTVNQIKTGGCFKRLNIQIHFLL